MLKQFLQETSIKSRNIKLVYRFIHRYGPTTKAYLIEQTKLKQTTMVRILDEMIEYNLIQINGYDESSGGRPPALYEINPTHNYIVGVDLSRTHTKIMLVDLSFTCIDQLSFVMTKEHTPLVTINLIKQKIVELFHRNHIWENQILGIGIGSVGPLDREKGVIVEPELFAAPGWSKVSIVEELEKSFPLKILLENGANTAALGEYYQSSISYRNILYCISGIGLRCGVLTNGHFVQNKTGDASAFGHMIINVKDEVSHSNIPENRTLSSYISLDAILEETKKRVINKEDTILLELADGKLNTSTIEHLLLGLKQGDQLIQDVIMKSAYYYGIGLANMVNVIHPEQVILSSQLIYELPQYYEEIIETAKEHIYSLDKLDVSFGKGDLEEDAVAIGASILIFDSYFPTY